MKRKFPDAVRDETEGSFWHHLQMIQQGEIPNPSEEEKDAFYREYFSLLTGEGCARVLYDKSGQIYSVITP